MSNNSRTESRITSDRREDKCIRRRYKSLHESIDSFLMTARQLVTLFSTNIKLALQYVGRWCMNLNALLYATFNVFILCTEKFHHNWQVYTGVQNDRIAVTGADIFTHISIGGLLYLLHFSTQGMPKQSGFHWSPAYTHLFSRYYQHGLLPESWTHAVVCPNFEKENRVLPENYRPISFIAIPFTLFEDILVSIILDHLNKDNNTSRQHGVRKGMSCDTQLIEELHDWMEIMNQGKGQIDVISLDVSNSCDTVPHRPSYIIV